MARSSNYDHRVSIMLAISLLVYTRIPDLYLENRDPLSAFSDDISGSASASVAFGVSAAESTLRGTEPETVLLEKLMSFF